MSVYIRDLIGTPFKVHGRSKEEGFDCYGLLIEIYKRQGIELPDINYKSLTEQEAVSNQLHLINRVEKIDKLENNCIIEIAVDNIPMHVGYYIGEGQFIHCREKFGTIIEPVYRWKSKIMGLYKVTVNSL